MRIKTKTNKMKSQDSKSLWAPQSEKPNHYTYLKEFRVEQCQLFLQHKCTQHRPYTCFHWHFLNQRRRRPIRKRDGTFSYSPDNYCPKFDENTGICPDGDECQLLHRTAGDTERRYHLRYYKTGMCVHDTDSRGMCVKNGPHCAFAHGVDDVRPPVYDIREIQAMESGENEVTNGVGPNSLDKERNMINEDPKWQDTAYVLANYKTETCKRPPRLCRQGYACPQYHNSRDRRRPPRKYKYRSTACPNVKHGDEWGEPANCESGDACQYCHTRTEQQFHPEIYKSTKCNDIQQNGYCPRGAFCAFAHVEQETSQIRETAGLDNCVGTSLADILQSALPQENLSSNSIHNNIDSTLDSLISSNCNSNPVLNNGSFSNSSITNDLASKSYQSLQSPALAPIGSKPRHLSGNGGLQNNIAASTSNNSGSPPPLSSSKDSNTPSSIDGYYPKAPGSERMLERETALKKQWASIEGDQTIDATEKAKRKKSLIHSVMSSSSIIDAPLVPPSTNCPIGAPPGLCLMGGGNVSPLSPAFYPTSDTVQSVIGNALDDLNIADSINLNSNLDSKSNSISSALSSSIPATSDLMGSSAPVNIPRSYHDLSALHRSQSPSSTSSPGFSQSSLLQSSLNRENSFNSYEQTPFLRTVNGGTSTSFVESSLFGVSPHYPLSSALSQSPMLSNLGNSNTNGSELQRLRSELLTTHAKMASWEEGMAQARSACQAWRREADEAKGKVQMSEQAREELVSKCSSQQKELDELRSQQLAPFVQTLHPQVDLGKLPLHTLKALQSQLKRDLLQVEKVINDLNMKNDQWAGVVPTW